MATTLVGISNSALIKVGADRIVSLDDATKEARLCKERVEKLRDEVITNHPWNFATRRAELANDAVGPISEFDNQSQMPADALRIFEVNDGSDDTPTYSPQARIFRFAIEGRKILHNLNPAFIKYAVRETVVAIWTATFAEALAFRLAADIAYALTNSRTLATEMLVDYRSFVAEARSYDAQEGSVRQIVASTWINARN